MVIVTVLVALLILSFLVVIHELGHFIAAKISGVKVEEFGIGIPPRVFGIKIGETLYSINLLPLGGFVRLYGETEEGKTGNSKRAFVNKRPLTKIFIASCGVIVNILFALFAFSFVYSFQGIPKERELGFVRVSNVVDGSPAKNAGVNNNDIIKFVDKLEINSTSEFIDYVSQRANTKIVLGVEREINGEKREIKINVTPQLQDGKGKVGVEIASSEIYYYYPPYWQRPIYGVYYGGRDALFFTRAILDGLYKMVFQLLGGQIPKEVAGPVAIVAITSEVTKLGFMPLINFAGIISLNLAILNLVPFPPLDGSRVLIAIFEKIRGKKIGPGFESRIRSIGMMLLLFLALILTIREVPKLIAAGSVEKFIEGLIQ